ncbi:MAG: hypothetical protein QM401_08320 [Bacillota bacterium]|nr:hypothetical protein [Bacillota bacterium]HHU62439.1 hypothetical protein [Natronincola sp.]
MGRFEPISLGDVIIVDSRFDQQLREYSRPINPEHEPFGDVIFTPDL